MTRFAVATVVALSLCPSLDARTDLATVLARAGTYVDGFERDFGSMVSEERYEQSLRPGTAQTFLVSDFLLVQLPGQGWVPFRDVFERDGQAVRDRQDRLTSLFLGNPRAALEQAKKIVDEGARYNIGNVSRNINVPTLTLPFLNPSQRHRFRFTDAKTDDAALGRAIDFTEVGRPTFITTSGGRNLPVTGRFWIDEDTGVVMRSELHAVDTAVQAHIVVTYRFDETVEVWVPARMEERYKRQRDTVQVFGVATYSKFRRFQVNTSEEVAH